MLERLAKGESGVVMGLAVILVVLIGVMGAGLLVFVRSDLEAVVKVNQGQRALNLADAGVQAARRQLPRTRSPTITTPTMPRTSSGPTSRRSAARRARR